MYPLPIGWSEDQFTQLHPGFVAALVPALLEADVAQLRVRYRSGYRANALQRELFETYESRLAAYERGELKSKPLPAAPPGSSAHNFAICVDADHVIGGADVCPECSAAAVPAAVACDVQILGPNGQPIFSGGDGPLEMRSAEWQAWAAILDRHPALRDGGDFASSKDPVHVEWVRWNHKTHALDEPRGEDRETRAASSDAAQPVTCHTGEGEPAAPPAAIRPRRGGGRRGPPPVES